MNEDKETNIERKPYIKPEISHELELEIRAGSGSVDPSIIDPLN